MKPKDLIKNGYHFYIWCLIDNENKPHFSVLSVKDFIETMGESMKGNSFFKDQDRQHFSENPKEMENLENGANFIIGLKSWSDFL